VKYHLGAYVETIRHFYKFVYFVAGYSICNLVTVIFTLRICTHCVPGRIRSSSINFSTRQVPLIAACLRAQRYLVRITRQNAWSKYTTNYMRELRQNAFEHRTNPTQLYTCDTN